jgi:serine/threonine protein kinase
VFVHKYTLEHISERVLEELLNDASASAQVSHAHLVPLVGVCVLPQQAFIVSEYMPRGSLRDLLNNAAVKLTYSLSSQHVRFVLDQSHTTFVLSKGPVAFLVPCIAHHLNACSRSF